jgi:ring-1,2-phenylacetyl-CoA epoxidase subunit PaaD
MQVNDMLSETKTLDAKVWAALYKIHDPEMPAISIVDLGMVNEVVVSGANVSVSLTPTFIGCPATQMIRKNVENELNKVSDVGGVSVKFVYDPPWTSDRITEKGRENLREFGIAPPKCHLQKMKTFTATCPYCESENTLLENMFGPTACRSMFYCQSCHQPFEAMKPV